MTSKRLAPIALAAAMLATAAPALGGSGSATALQIEQLGPKHALGASSCQHQHQAQYISLGTGAAQTCPRLRYIALATHSIPITQQTLDVEELGPKQLLH